MTADGNTRRRAIVSYLSNSTGPVNGTELAAHFKVSRQVIVQDVALLRAESTEILSTNKGYLLKKGSSATGKYTAVIMVQHTSEETLQEMQTIVEYGGSMLDVFVDHDIYGQIRANLIINDMKDAEEFCRRMKQSESLPLKELTGACHYHTVTAPSEKVMKLIKSELKEKGFLIE